MIVTPTTLENVLIIEPVVHRDNRGWFTESYNKIVLEDKGIDFHFIQDNHSYSSKKGTVRGLHYQNNPKTQTKLVRCTNGSIFDVAVDIRRGSPDYGKWFGIELSADNKKQLLIPKGFAHGFLTLTDNVEVQYKCDQIYAPDCDGNILWNDPEIGIEWPIKNNVPIISTKDRCAPLLKDAYHNFIYTIL